MKIFFRRIHLYLSIAAGVVIMITCLTGALLVFQDELLHAFHKQRYYVTAGNQHLPINILINNLQQKVAGSTITNVKVYNNKQRTVEIGYTVKQPPTTQTKKTKSNNEGGDRKTAFVNPYSGAVIELYNFRDTFFYKVMALHRWLLGGAAGKLIVGISTIIFLFILITGFILWWPKSKNILKQRLTIKWSGGFKRLVHDLHIVFGFYAFIFLFIFAFTGLAWSFEWFNKGIYKVTNSSMQPAKPPAQLYNNAMQLITYDAVLQLAKNNFKDAVYYNISAPKDAAATYAINTLSKKAVHESAGDTYFINKYTGEIIGTNKWSERNTGQRVRATFKPLHVASIYGNTSKIIGLIVCLLGASFPVTGSILWYNRTRKKRLT
jgi:uncharacterized iron-regulated membrane protein